MLTPSNRYVLYSAVATPCIVRAALRIYGAGVAGDVNLAAALVVVLRRSGACAQLSVLLHFCSAVPGMRTGTLAGNPSFSVVTIHGAVRRCAIARGAATANSLQPVILCCLLLAKPSGTPCGWLGTRAAGRRATGGSISGGERERGGA